VWLENDGLQHFDEHVIANDPIKLVTVATGDLNGDGRMDIVAGGLHLYPPFDRVGRISSWVTRPGPGPRAPVPAKPADARDESAPHTGPPLPDLRWADSNVSSDLTELHDRLAAKVSAKNDLAADWLEVGKAYYAFGYFPEAMGCFEVSVEREPDMALANYMLGVVLQRMGRLPEAVTQFEHTLTLAPGNQQPLIWHEIGRCYLRLEDVGRAEDAFITAGNFPASLFQLARLRVKLGREEETLSILNELTRVHPRAVELFILKAKVAESMGMDNSAQAFRDRAEYSPERLPVEPTYGAAIAEGNKYGVFPEGERARQLIMEQKWDEAATILRTLIPGTERTEPVIMLAETDVGLGKPQEAIERLEALIESHGAESKALSVLGQAYLESGQPEKAVRVWEELEQTQPLEVMVHKQLAEHYDRIGESDAARRQEALKLESIGISALRQAKPLAARTSLEAAVALDPALPRSWFYLGECCRILDDMPAARTAYRKALQINPNHGRAHARLALVPD
jgi:tetratricopeptide (TPR) repeat protein